MIDVKKADWQIKRLEFYVSSSCYNNCIFCGEQELLAKFKNRFVSLEEIKKKITKKAAEGYNFIVLTGGEPTLHPNIIEAARLAKKLKYYTFINSAGGLFASEDFCQKIMPYIDVVSFSIYGHNAKLHNLHTRNKKSFAILADALENAEKTSGPTRISARVLITSHNFADLKKIINYLNRYKKIEKILFSSLMPEGRAIENYKKLTVPLSGIKNKIPELARLVKKKSRQIKFFGLPLCVLGESRERSSDTKLHDLVTIKKVRRGGRETLDETKEFKPLNGIMKPEKCKRCLENKFCPGIFRKYYEEFGDKELISFK